MVIDINDIKKSIGGNFCAGCPHFDLELYEVKAGDLVTCVELGCSREDLCTDLYGKALERAHEHYRLDVKLP